MALSVASSVGHHNCNQRGNSLLGYEVVEDIEDCLVRFSFRAIMADHERSFFALLVLRGYINCYLASVVDLMGVNQKGPRVVGIDRPEDLARNSRVE